MTPLKNQITHKGYANPRENKGKGSLPGAIMRCSKEIIETENSEQHQTRERQGEERTKVTARTKDKVDTNIQRYDEVIC